MAVEAGYSPNGATRAAWPGEALGGGDAPVTAARAPRGTITVSRSALRWFVVALAVRLVAALLIHAYSLSRGFGGLYPLASGHDDVVYWDLAQRIYRGLPVPYVDNNYPYVLAFFFRFTGGPDLLLGKMLNVLAGSITVALGVLLVSELARGQMSKKQRRRAVAWAGAVLTFYPSLLWYSAQLLKDPILVMLGMAALLFQVRLLRRPRPGLAVAWALASGGLYFFRPYAALALALSLLLFTLRFKRRWLVPSLLLAAIVPYALGRGWFGLSYIAPLLDTEHLSAFRENQYSIGGSAANISIDYSSPLSFASSYSYSFATAMFGPFPWQISASGQLIAVPEAIVMWTLFPVWLGGLREVLSARARRDKARRLPLLLMLFSLVLVGAVALFSDNIGANTRLRLLPWCAFLLYAALKMGRKKIVI